MCFTPTAHIGRGQECKAYDGRSENSQQTNLMSQICVRVQPEAYRPDADAQYHQRVQAYQTDLKKISDGHFSPPVIIRITHNKTREQIKKINSQITVWRRMISDYGIIRFK